MRTITITTLRSQRSSDSILNILVVLAFESVWIKGVSKQVTDGNLLSEIHAFYPDKQSLFFLMKESQRLNRNFINSYKEIY